MNEEIIADFKQFISATVSQQTNDLRGDMREMREDIKEMRGDIERLDQKIDDLSISVAEAIETTNEETHKLLQNHENRISHLEAKISS